MKTTELQHDHFIDKSLGAQISYHSIKWTKSGKAVSIPTGGNIHYHTIPESGTFPHYHEFAEIVLIVNGQILHHINGECQKLKAGHLVFIRPSDKHSFKPIENEPCDLLLFSYTLELLLTLSRFFEDDSFMWKLTERVMPPTFLLQRAESDDLANRLLGINSGSVRSLSAARTRIKVIIADLFSTYFLEDMQNLTESNVPDWLEELCQKMQKPDNLSQGLKRMQHLACCTPEHLCKSFRRYLNKTPTEFLNELRITYAARQLVDTNQEIMAVAFDLKFNSLSRFYHLFKKHYGMAPAKYRAVAKRRKGII